jgi:molybdopterin-guanine dinucleotide biosynthesis protein A
MNCGGIILCGGQSTRMGQPKAWLQWGNITLLEHMVHLLVPVVKPLVVVAAAGQLLPPLPPQVLLACDSAPEQGPLEGLAVGLETLAPLVPCAFVSGCDAPLLAPQLIERLYSVLADPYEIAVPCDDERLYPLAALYRTSLVPHVRQLLSDDERRLKVLCRTARSTLVPLDHLRDFDPQLRSFLNLNDPCAWEQAQALAFPESQPVVPRSIIPADRPG